MTTLMLLGAGLSQYPLYIVARRLGLKVVGADPNPAAPALALAHHRVVCDLADVQTLLRTAMRHGVSGVLTFAADYPMPALARVCSELGLPGPSEQAVHRATHKGAMRAAFERAGVPSPWSFGVDTAAGLWAAVQEHGGELIVKPAQSSGGRGVTVLPPDADEAAVAQAYAHAAAATRDRRSVLLESCVPGPEYSIESVVFHGRHHVVAVTDKLTSGPPHCVEIGHHQPATVTPAQRDALHRVAQQAVRALGIDHAVCHTEAKLTPRGPVVIETAARAGGGFITSHLVPLSTGIDLMAAAIHVALGRAPPLRPAALPQAAAIRSLISSPGRIVAVHGLELASTMPGVRDVQIYKQVGAHVAPLQDASARCGHVIAVAETAAEAVARACAARDALQVVTQPAPPSMASAGSP